MRNTQNRPVWTSSTVSTTILVTSERLLSIAAVDLDNEPPVLAISYLYLIHFECLILKIATQQQQQHKR